MMKIKNLIFEHLKTGNLYLVLGEAELKNPSTRSWEDAVLYKPLYGDMSKTYVRELNDFVSKFKAVQGIQKKES